MGHDQADGTSVFRRQGLTTVMGGQQVVLAVQVGQGQVRGVVRRRMDQHELRRGLGSRELEDLTDGDAGKPVVVPAPSSNAVDVAEGLLVRQRVQLGPGQRERALDKAADLEAIARRVEGRDRAGVQHRPLPGLDLSGWQSCVRRLRHVRSLSTDDTDDTD